MLWVKLKLMRENVKLWRVVEKMMLNFIFVDEKLFVQFLRFMYFLFKFKKKKKFNKMFVKKVKILYGIVYVDVF